MKNELLEKYGAIALNAIFGYEPLKARRIVETLGGAAPLFLLNQREVRELLGASFQKFGPKIGDFALEDARREMEELESAGCDFIPCTSPDFPRELLECEDGPVGLYIKSDSPAREVFNRAPGISIVGTRDISPYGKQCCQRIVSSLAEAVRKPVIISGLAIGVDICAHIGALETGLATIAVLPTGIDSIYPWRHRGIAERIVKSSGSALVTDFPPGTGAQAFTFLRRNRIIAGLGASTILVESKAKGGGMITARLACGYQRSVFAVPGRIDDLRSAGCNALMAEKIADTLCSPETLCTELGLGYRGTGASGGLSEELDRKYSSREDFGEIRRIALIIKSSGGINIEELSRRASLDYAQTASLAALLESDGLINIDLLQRCTINHMKRNT